MKEIGISEEKTLDVIRLLNQIVQKGIKSNISLQDQLLSIYILSKAMGFSEPEIEEEVAQILIDYIKKGDKQG
jgi:aspartate/glutamate racemase